MISSSKQNFPPATQASIDKLFEDHHNTLNDNGLVVELNGFEGPLDLLLYLARTQKVDLVRISVLALAEQYLSFVENAQKLRLELAADYLVMAAWLAFLKSKLLFPHKEDDKEQNGEDMARALAFRLKRLEAMREAAKRLINRNHLGRDILARGMPEAIIVEKKSLYTASLYDLLTAYTSQCQRLSSNSVTITCRKVWSLKEAREMLVRVVGDMSDWTALDQFLLKYLYKDKYERRMALASFFAASLEMVREGYLDMRQEGFMSPVFLRGSVENKSIGG